MRRDRRDDLHTQLRTVAEPGDGRTDAVVVRGDRGGLADPAYDALVAQASATADPARRAALLRGAERRLLLAAPILSIYHYVSRSLVAPDVRGWQDNAMNIHPSRLLYRVTR